MDTKLSLMNHRVWSKPLPDNLMTFKTISTLNAHSYCIAKQDADFHKALDESGMLLPDGISIVFAAWLIKGKRIRKIAGADLHQHVIKRLAATCGSCFYLGSSPAVLELIKEKMDKEYPGIRCGFHSPPFREHFSLAESNTMIDLVNKFGPDVLFVGMTAPKQEKWVQQHRQGLKVPLVCSIGAVFDFYAGTVKRPGKRWIRTGLEFLPRLWQEPRRLWRRTFISSPLFLIDMVLYRIGILKEHKKTIS